MAIRSRTVETMMSLAQLLLAGVLVYFFVAMINVIFSLFSNYFLERRKAIDFCLLIIYLTTC